MASALIDKGDRMTRLGEQDARRLTVYTRTLKGLAGVACRAKAIAFDLLNRYSMTEPRALRQPGYLALPASLTSCTLTELIAQSPRWRRCRRIFSSGPGPLGGRVHHCGVLGEDSLIYRSRLTSLIPECSTQQLHCLDGEG